MKKIVTKKGFTLIELMIVMVIMGVLALIGLNAFEVSQKRGRDSKRKSDLAQVAKALEMYANDSSSGGYPLADNGKIVGCDGIACNWGKVFRNSTTIYMQLLPNDPRSPNNTYFYRPYVIGTTAKGYYLFARLELPGTNDVESMTITLNGEPFPNKTFNCGTTDVPANCNYKYKSPNLEN